MTTALIIYFVIGLPMGLYAARMSNDVSFGLMFMFLWPVALPFNALVQVWIHIEHALKRKKL